MAQNNHIRVSQLFLLQLVVREGLDPFCIAHVQDLLADFDVLLEAVAKVDVEYIVVLVFLAMRVSFDLLGHFEQREVLLAKREGVAREVVERLEDTHVELTLQDQLLENFLLLAVPFV